MPTNNLSTLKRSLSSFIRDVRKNYQDGEQVDEAVVERLKNRYRNLYESYRTLGEDTIHREFSGEQT